MSRYTIAERAWILSSIGIACAACAADEPSTGVDAALEVDAPGAPDVADADVTANPPETVVSDAAEASEVAVTVPDLVLAIDRGAGLGPVRPLTGVNKSPLLAARTTTEVFDFTSLYQAFGVSAVRAHDGVVDLCRIYLDDRLARRDGSILDADLCAYSPNGPSDAAVWSVVDPLAVDAPDNYDFAAADAQIDAIIDGGFELMLRLGESYNGPNDTTDPVAWGRVAGRVFEHFARGWPSPALDARRAPAWVEIHNEPDGFFWLGSAQGFLSLYAETWERVRAIASASGGAPSVGGSGFTDGGVERWLRSEDNIVARFVEINAGSRLDFLSVHHYGDCDAAEPGALADYLRRVRAALDAQGGAGTPLVLSEWNIGLGARCGNALFTTDRAAAYLAASLALQHDPTLGLVRSYLYAGVPPMSLFTADERGGALSVNPSAYAFAAASALGGELVSLALCDATGAACVDAFTSSVAGEPVHAVAARAADGGIEVLVVNHGEARRSVEVRLDAASAPPATWQVHRAAHGGAPVALASTRDAAGHLVPTEDALNQALAKVRVEALAGSGSTAQVELGPWEVVRVRAR